MSHGEGPLFKGALFRIEGPSIVDKVHFHFNPTEIQEKSSATWNLSEAPGQILPAASLIRTGTHTISLQLLLYGREAGIPGRYMTLDIDKTIAQLRLFNLPGSQLTSTRRGTVPPPTAWLVLGETIWYGIVPTVDFSHKQFDRKMRPVRTVVTINFKSVSRGFDADLARLNRIRKAAQ